MKAWKHKTRYGEFSTFTSSEDVLKAVFEVKQTHSKIVHDMTGAHPDDSLLEGDGLLFQQLPAHPVLIKTADCLPVLLEGDHGVAMIHSGWRGLQQKIFDQDRLRQLQVTHITIGPHICQNHYEVGQDFTEFFPESDNYVQRDDKLYWSLLNEGLMQLEAVFDSAQITISPLCTFERPELHSYRLSKTNQRNLNLFTPNGKDSL